MTDTAGESLGTARIDVTVNTATMQAGLDAAKSKVSGLGAEAEAQFDRANASTKRYAQSQLNQINLLGKTRVEQIAYNAQLKIGGALGDAIAQKALAQGAAMQATVGATQAASAAVHEFSLNNSFARRELGRLVSDMANGNYGRFEQTSLTLANASGLLGKAFTVAGAAIAGTAIAVGVLVKAFIDGQGEQEAYNKALIETGNFAGVTADRLGGMAQQLASVSGTQHDAADALAKAAATGKFTADQIQLVARATDEAGDGADRMLQEFVKLADDPAKAIAQLNETQHFLTAATYDQIKALEDQGRTQDAITLAIKTYSDTVVERTAQVKESLGYLEIGWNAVKDAAKGGWDAMLDIGRPGAADKVFGPIKSYLSDVVSLFHQFQNPMAAVFGQGLGAQAASNTQHTDAQAAARQALQDQANQFDINLQQQIDGAKTAEQKRVASIVKIVGESNQQIDNAVKAGNKTLADQIAAHEAQLVQALQAQSEKKLSGHVSNAGAQALSSLQQYVNGLDSSSLFVQGDSALTKYVQDMAKLEDEFDKAIAKGANASAATDAYWQGAADNTAKFQHALNAATAEEQAYQQALDLEVEARKNAIDIQIESIGMGQKEAQRLQELNALYQDEAKTLAQLATAKALHPEQADAIAKEIDAQRGKFEQLVQATVEGYARMDKAQGDWHEGFIAAAKDLINQGQNVAGMVSGTFTDAFGNMNDAIANFVTTGKLDLKNFADSFIEDLTRIALKMEESQLLNAVLGYFFPGATNVGNTTYAGGNTFFGAGYGVGNYAKGGVFDSPSLSQYSNGVYTTPQFFVTKHAQGNVFGEAGPEAVMPLSRDSSGRLGVKAQGGSGGDVIINIENNSGAQATATQSKDTNGNDVVKIIIAQAVTQSVGEVNKQIARGGSTSQILQQTFGLSRRGIPVSG